MVKQETCSLTGHKVSLSPEDQRSYEQILRIYQQAGIQPPSQADVLDRIKKDKTKGEKLIKLLLDEVNSLLIHGC